MTLGKLLFLYTGWVRGKPAREALAAFGVAVGVALVFATLTANQSIGGASDQIMSRLAGSAQLQASARSPEGVQEAALDLRSTPAGVARTAFALQAPAAIISHGKTVVTQLLGVSPAAVAMNTAVADVPFATNGLVLPAALAAKLDVRNRAIVTVAARGRATRVPVQAVLGAETIGPLAYSLIAAGDLQYVQRLLGLPGRVSLILARVKPGQQATARAALQQTIGPGMEVTDTSSEQRLLAQALLPQNESTSFFALLGVLVGVLLAGSAMMLTMADRRDELKALRLQGFSRRQLVAIVISQGVILGTTASLAGVAVGFVLAISLFAGSPDYLASAFPLGTQTTISVTLALGVWAGGVAITCLCTAPALRRPRRPHEAPHKGLQMLACGVVLTAGAILVGSRSLVSAALLTAGLLLAVPAWLAGVVRAAEWPSWSARLRRLVIAAGSVRALGTRAVALACTAAVGVFGAVVAQSTHRDLLAGLERGYAQYVGSAPIWVTSPGDDLATSSFPAGSLAERISRLQNVRTVRPYYGGWIDNDGRRVWLIARNPGVPAGELVQGGQPRPGTAALSLQLAHALHAHLGTRITVPTPQGAQRLTVVATTTNLGWSPGVMFLSPADYTRWWGNAPAALEVDAPASTLAAIQHTVGPGLQVQTANQRAANADALPRQGLQRLSQIAWLLVAAAAVAVALAISAAIWQRRGELASLRLQSFTPRQVQAVLAWEAILVVGSGVLLGLLAGTCGHLAADAYLRASTGYPVTWSLQAKQLADVATLVAAVTALVLAAPGFLAARAPLRLALE